MASRTSRRTFVKGGLYAGITVLTVPGIARSFAANEKLKMAVIGIGGQGSGGVGTALGQQLVAYTDVDVNGKGKDSLAKIKQGAPDAKGYTDYRRMFEAHKDIEAVWIATPDHHHFSATTMALSAGAGVYCEKPLTWSLWEARKLREFAMGKKLATQMGNQGHSTDSIRVACEYVWSGALGDVTEVHCVSNRGFAAKSRPAPATPPEGLDWEAWIGPAAMREYHGGLHPFGWRGYRDFGTGSLGDMGCHTIDAPTWALKLNESATVELEAEVGKPTDEGFAPKARIIYRFPARGPLPPVKLTWWHGGGDFLPPRPPALEEGQKVITEGTYYYGSKCMMTTNSHAGGVRLIPDSKVKEIGKPPVALERVKSHSGDFINACKTGKPASSNFEYAGRLTEIVLLGNIACAVGEKITYDFATGRFNNDKANAMLKRDPRKGWEMAYA